MALIAQDVYVHRNRNGSLTVSAIIEGYRRHTTFYGYDRKQAVRRFLQAHRNPTQGATP